MQRNTHTPESPPAIALEHTRRTIPARFVIQNPASKSRRRHSRAEVPMRKTTPELETAWETLRVLAHGIEPRSTRKGAAWNREQLQRIDLRWHDLRHEGACRLLGDGVDIRIIQLMLGHASILQTQRYLNVTDEELRRGLEVSWNNKGRPLRLASGA